MWLLSRAGLDTCSVVTAQVFQAELGCVTSFTLFLCGFGGASSTEIGAADFFQALFVGLAPFVVVFAFSRVTNSCAFALVAKQAAAAFTEQGCGCGGAGLAFFDEPCLGLRKCTTGSTLAIGSFGAFGIGGGSLVDFASSVTEAHHTGQAIFTVVVVGFVEVAEVVAGFSLLAGFASGRSTDSNGWVVLGFDAPAPSSPTCFVGFVGLGAVGETPGCADFFLRTGSNAQLAGFAVLVAFARDCFGATDLTLDADLSVGAACVGTAACFAFTSCASLSLRAVVG